MNDLMVAGMFMLMVLSPCFVAAATGLHEGSDAGMRDPDALNDLSARSSFIPK